MSPRTPEDFEADRAFEMEAIVVARALFTPDRPFQGSTIVDARERDGIFVGDDLVVAIEATTSRALVKAEKDGRKLRDLCDKLAAEHRFKAIKGFFITRDEPTPEQRRFIDGLKAPIVACSLAQLRSQLVNSREYLELRDLYAFGSARNPGNGSATDLDKYIPITLLSVRDGGSGSAMGADDLVTRTQAGLATIVLGDFGAGKSMTLREVHRQLASAHLRNSAKPFPVTLNLRDHKSQRDPDEALRRHAALIGFEHPNQLVKAWRSGSAYVLLDGFDEIATTGWQGRTANLQQLRRNSVELVRRFVSETPSDVGLLMTGRRHFFDNQVQLISDLGVRPRSPEILATDQFTDEQVRDYLTEHGWMGALPSWLPSHPLLLGYLATAGVLQQLTEADSALPFRGWNILLDRICEREAHIEVGIDGQMVRRVLERLATIARTRPGGVGPLHQTELAIAFEQVCGFPPDEGSYVVLQRMPGLGVQDAADGSRYFIDQSLVDAARAGDLVRYASNVDSDSVVESLRNLSATCGSLGIGVAVASASSLTMTPAQVNAAAKRVQQRGGSDAIALDLVRIAVDLGSSSPGAFVFRDLEIDNFTFDDATDDLGLLSFHDCVIEKIDLTEYDGQAVLPTFQNCIIQVVNGAGSVDALPAGRFPDCVFEEFDPSSKTTRGILAMPGLNPKQKVCLTVLKKTYVQAGSGRKESALHRGLDEKLRQHVDEVLNYLVSQGLLVRGRVSGNNVYYPTRGNTARVRRLIEAGVSAHDEVVTHFA